MSVLGGPPAHAGGGARGLGHTAVVVSSQEELLGTALPWLRDGLAGGDLTVLSCDEETAGLLCAELGPDGAGLVVDPRVTLRGTRPPDAVTAARQLLGRAAGSPSGTLRVLGAPHFGPAPRDWRETQRYESVVNQVLAGVPIDTLCLYDRRRLPEQAAQSARSTHPQLLVGGVPTPNPEYRPPAEYVAALPLPREPIEQGRPVFDVAGAPNLAGLRHALAEVLAAHVPDREQREDLHLAVSEIAANAFRHGTPPVSARVWASADWIVCTVTDSGTGWSGQLAGFQPAHGADLSRGGMGVWLARKLWDHVDLLSGPDGLTVRLSSPLR